MRDGNLKTSLDGLVEALCLDYSRRLAAIEEGSVTRRTLIEFRYLNIKIYDAAAEILGERYARIYIDEIGRNVGYAKSEMMDSVSEVTYKRYKRLIKDNIAKKLHLSD